MSRSARTLVSFRAIFLVAGGAMLALCAWLTVRMVWFLSIAVPADGKVVAVESAGRVGHARGRSYRPVFEFRDATGETNRVRERFSSRPPLFSRGEKVRVLYDPDKPQRAHIRHFMTLWFAPLITFVLGAGFTYASYAIRKRSKSRAADQR